MAADARLVGGSHDPLDYVTCHYYLNASPGAVGGDNEVHTASPELKAGPMLHGRAPSIIREQARSCQDKKTAIGTQLEMPPDS